MAEAVFSLAATLSVTPERVFAMRYAHFASMMVEYARQADRRS